MKAIVYTRPHGEFSLSGDSRVYSGCDMIVRGIGSGGTGMEKENSASGGGGGGGGGGGAEATAGTPGATSTSEKLQADQANPLLDPTALFGAYWPRGDSAASSLFGGMPGGYGLGAPHLPSAYAILGRGSSAPGFGGHTPASAPPPSPYPHSSLGTLSVAASQAASLGQLSDVEPRFEIEFYRPGADLPEAHRVRVTGINPAASAWWTMASHLAAQDYLARLQGAAGLPGFPPGAESLLPPYPASLLNPPSLSSHKSTKSSKSHKTPASSSSSTTPSMTSSSLPVSTQPPVTSSHHSTPVSSTPNSQSNVVSDPSSILGGVRLPPDTEIIKYTSSIVGPKVPGTTNRGRKKTISLDTPSVSVHPPAVPALSAHQINTTSTASLMMEPRKYNRTGTDSNEYRDSVDRVEVIKLPAHSTNGSVLSAPPTYTSSSSSGNSNANNNINDSDAPLNLSLKPATTSSSSPISGSQPLSQLSNLSQSLLASDRTSRRKPGPKPRRVPQNSVPVPASPSPSLAQLFAAADSPQRPSSGSEESESASTATHHKDGRPRNLGRGVSKPKKNTVASLLAQSRALGIKPTPTLDPSVPLSHQVSLLRSNILAAQLHASVATGQDDKNQKSLQEKMKNKLLEASGEESNMDVTSESGSNTDVVTDTDDDNTEGTPSAKRRKLKPSERDLQMPLERGWKRETVIKGLGKTGVIKGDVSYYSPCGKTFRSSPDLVKVGYNILRPVMFLEHQNPAELTTANFSFSSRPLVGEFLQPTMGLAEAEFVRLGAQEVARRLEELRAVGGFRDARPNNQYERDKLAYAKKLAKEEAQRHKEQARLIKEQEKTERQETLRREREIRNQQLLEGRKRLAFTIKQKMKIIQEIERGKSKSDVARELGLASSTVATIWKNRESIAESWRNRDMMHQADVEDPTAPISSSSNLSSTTTSTGTTTATMPPDNTQQAQTQTQSQELLEERELKRQQAVMLKEQMYMQELTKQREMLYTVELERERRRQHMTLVRALENRRKMEEKEKKRLEARAERIATKEKRAEQRRVEMELIEQIRKPVEDMELTDHRPLPEVKRIPGLKLSGQAFADIVMVFEFLHNFGETLGFDMESLPSLKSLQLALLNDEEAEEEMLSVMTHLLVCAIEDPGIPQPARHTTGLGQSLRQADITHANISEVLRIYLYANATGEVKALTGVCLERERDKKFADHHQNGGDYASTCSGKNAQFYEHLHNNETWKMSERLRDKPFLALNPTHKAQMLAFLCNELLQNKAVIRQIEGSLETVAQLRKERFVLDTKIRKLRQLHSRKVRMEAVGVIVNKIGDTITIEKKEGEEEGNTTSTAVGTTPTPDEIHHEDEVEDMSENESEGTQPEEEEDKNLSGEELGKKLDKLLKQSEEQLQKLNSSSKQLRAHIFGQDRYWRRYWELACAGGIFVEAMESAEPEILDLQAELDEKYKNMPVEEKSEVKQEGEGKTNSENHENEAPNEVKDEKKHNSNEQDEDMKSHEDKLKSEVEEVNFSYFIFMVYDNYVSHDFFNIRTGDPNLAALKAEQAAAANANSNNSEQNNQAPAPPEETTPRGLNTWREATARAHTSAQLAMALYMLEASIAWDKSIMKAVSLTTARNSVCAKLRNRCVSLKATNQYKQLLTTSQTSNCQFCHSGDNEDKLLLCDGCDRGYHTYCFRPKMENIPDGDWYCHECMNKATGERNCLVCGKRAGKNLVLCELCPRAYHTDCHNPVMPKMPRGKWYCSNCHSKQPKKRNSSRRSHTKGGGTRESESSDHPPARTEANRANNFSVVLRRSPTPSTASNTHVEDVSSSEPPTPTASPRKEGNNRTLTKKQQRELAPCKILLEQLEQQDEAWPFLLPVNTKQFPTYKKIIKTPMDLSTIKKKLQDSAYKSRDEFCADVRQMFINCEVFNEDDSPVGKAGHGMRSFFEMRWTEITGAPPPHPQTHS
ncbi:Bromodomain Adjacent To Zinc Finger protein [Temnothorax longispinosus]|uniref:Bromodomain Adjacent To Zinc Finger protein n=1 Tax=Temnothorax longispinosus TaxID=300112 RepID=A0A4S2KED2_9HYME|nr:Bromodomain Adjacent To Zinc Finger protein [Temnothorax longispinosus]